mgnify:CR=1 FL=1
MHISSCRSELIFCQWRYERGQCWKLRASGLAGAVIGCYRVLSKLMAILLRSLEGVSMLSPRTFPRTLTSLAAEALSSTCGRNENIT